MIGVSVFTALLQAVLNGLETNLLATLTSIDTFLHSGIHWTMSHHSSLFAHA
jgi:hypothetical protein